MRPIIVFDVNETLLDLSPVRTWFSERFDDAPSAGTWFSELLRLSFVSSTIDRYTPFPQLGAAALEAVTERHGKPITDEDLSHIGGVFATLPAHPDSPVGLDQLKEAGFRVAALTNSPLATAHAQLDNAGLADRFDEIMSVELVKRFKPHASVYQAAAEVLGVSPAEMLMVAAHDWDIAGSMAVDCAGAFIHRPGRTYSSAFSPPTLTATDIQDAATQITHLYT